MENKNIIILGGYGNFGKRITENLLYLKSITIFITGRSYEKASELCVLLAQKKPSIQLKPAQLDIQSTTFEQELADLKPFLVIHTGGPFQGQDYTVPKACIKTRSHYIDLADDRRFVCDINKLDSAAKENKVLLVSGASSVPGLSSTVVDHYLPQFEQLKIIDFAISPGNKAERGEATVRAILSYTGHPFKVLRNKQWLNVFGWGESRKKAFGGSLGSRWLANIDIPDLELFPSRYPSAETVHFQAGLEVTSLHHGMSLMSKMVQLKLVKNWAPLTKWIVKGSELLLSFGTNDGGMQMTLKGVGNNGQPLQIDWTLFAENGVGPYIPIISTIILAKKLINQSINKTGAMPCQGMYNLEEFDHYAQQWGIFHTEERCQPEDIR